MERLIECVANFSEGKDLETLGLIASAISTTPKVKLLHQDSGVAANRTVFTFVGDVEELFEAAFNAAKVATERIDMRTHKGEHPRIGALDVCPFIPIKGITKEELLPLVDEFAKRLNDELNIPVFLYEDSAKNLERKNLANHRIGGYENLESRMLNQSWEADYGKEFNPITGGTVCGARNFLLAYNINLSTKELGVAKKIAYSLRQSGWPEKHKYANEAALSKHLECVKSIAWYIEDFDKVQVSINLTDYKKTALWKVHESCKELAEEFGTEVTGSELIGLIPLEAILECGEFYYPNAESATKKELIAFAIEGLGLSDIEEFKPEERIIEYLIESQNV